MARNKNEAAKAAAPANSVGRPAVGVDVYRGETKTTRFNREEIAILKRAMARAKISQISTVLRESALRWAAGILGDAVAEKRARKGK